MWKTVLAAVLGLLALHCGVAHAAKTWDDMSWWGNTGAKPEPKADAKGRVGCWWLPVEAAKNDQDVELWGNRGVVFHAWKKPTPEINVEKSRDYTEHPGRVIVDPLVFNSILFDFGKAVMRAEGKAEADKSVAELKQWSRDTLIIEGHASSEGDEAYNMALGQRRADAVKKYMVESGIAPERIKTVSFGESRPAVPNDVEANRKLNRRAEFKMIYLK